MVNILLTKKWKRWRWKICCISKTNSTFIDNVDNLDIVIPMYNLLEYSQNYLIASGSLWDRYRDQIDDVDDDNTSNDKWFKCKAKIVAKIPETPAQSDPDQNKNQSSQPLVLVLNVEVTTLLKYLSNF